MLACGSARGIFLRFKGSAFNFCQRGASALPTVSVGVEKWSYIAEDHLHKPVISRKFPKGMVEFSNIFSPIPPKNMQQNKQEKE